MTQNHSDPITSQDNWPSDDSAPSNLGNPINRSEIEDLIYDGDLSVGERLARLRTMRDELQMQDAEDVGADDPRSLLMSIDDAIAELEASETGSEIGVVDADGEPADALEPLSPDDDLRMAVEAEIEDELSADEDEEAAMVSDWDAENDGHDGRHGFH